MDKRTIDDIGVPSLVLMENAARSWVEAVTSVLEKSRRIFVFCGARNNGGDGYAIARIIQNQGLDCRVIAAKPPKSDDCQTNASIWRHYGETIDWASFTASPPLINPDDVLIDAILGTGVETPLRGDLPGILAFIDELPGHKLAVDLPSGISASTGDNLGQAIQAELTITFQKEKVGHHLYPGKSISGKVICQKISIQEIFDTADQAYYLLDKALAKSLLPDRKPDAYKNTFGHAAIWCGSPGTIGAAILASHSAIKTGVGLVTSALPRTEQNTLLNAAPELMTFPQENISQDWLSQFSALVIGCGLGRDQRQWERIESILKQVSFPTLFDADAFHGIKRWDQLNLDQAVLTPHAGEFSQLSGFEKPATNRERLAQGLEFVKKNPTTLVLKGAPTLIFSSRGDIYINASGNAGMATAGSGDVLAGIIGGWLAQGLTPLDAALLGTWIHGTCGDIYAGTYNQESLTASNLIDSIRLAISDLKQN